MKLIRIADFDAPELDVYMRLNEKELCHLYEPDGGIFIAESPKVILRALNSGLSAVSMLVAEEELRGEAQQVLSFAEMIPVYTAPVSVLRKMTGFAMTRGMLAAMKRPELPSAEQLAGRAERIAVLENVVNPTNIGAIFRSAAAMGYDAVLLTSASSDPFYRRAARVSMGTVFQIPFAYLKASSGREAVCYLKKLGYTVCAMALGERSVSLDDPGLKVSGKLAVVLGTEGEGLSEDTIAASDFTVRIPMANGVDSLNVAAAAAVAFWEFRKR